MCAALDYHIRRKRWRKICFWFFFIICMSFGDCKCNARWQRQLTFVCKCDIFLPKAIKKVEIWRTKSKVHFKSHFFYFVFWLISTKKNDEMRTDDSSFFLILKLVERTINFGRWDLQQWIISHDFFSGFLLRSQFVFLRKTVSVEDVRSLEGDFHSSSLSRGYNSQFQTWSTL